MSAINTDAVKKQADAVASAYARLAKARNDYATIKGLGGYQGYSLNIGGVSIAVAKTDSFYQCELIRGREMIHLGACKTLHAMISEAEESVVSEEKKLAAMAVREVQP